jgi:hypothetical protein
VNATDIDGELTAGIATNAESVPVTVFVGQLGSGRHRLASKLVAFTSTDNSCVQCLCDAAAACWLPVDVDL